MKSRIAGPRDTHPCRRDDWVPRLASSCGRGVPFARPASALRESGLLLRHSQHRFTPAITRLAYAFHVAAQSDTLMVGERAPDFALQAANSSEPTSLSALLQRGPAIIEFLRGTW